MKSLLAAALALALAAPLPATAKDVAGQAFADSVDVGGTQLTLNGVGIRKKVFIKVYAAGLYLPKVTHDADGVVTPDVPKRVRMVFLRGVTRAQVMDAFKEGFEKNTGGSDLPDLIAKLEKLTPAIPAEFKEGQELTVSYVPGEGAIVKGTGTDAVTIPGKAFADALFRNWFGKYPADGGLKTGLLGN